IARGRRRGQQVAEPSLAKERTSPTGEVQQKSDIGLSPSVPPRDPHAAPEERNSRDETRRICWSVGPATRGRVRGGSPPPWEAGGAARPATQRTGQSNGPGMRKALTLGRSGVQVGMTQKGLRPQRGFPQLGG